MVDIPIALQLYSLREEVERDLTGTLRRVAELGFKGVEFASFYHARAEEIRAALDETGLAVAGSNASLRDLVGDRFDQTLAFHQAIGSDCIIVAGGLSPGFHTDTGNRVAAMLFDELSIKSERHGVHIGFHAHMNDFAKIDGQTAWDRFFSRTRREVVMQIDVGNFFSGNADPYATIARFPGRTRSIHLKSFPRGCIFGSDVDTVDWPRIFRLCETTGGTQWYLIELVAYAGMSPFRAVETSLKNFFAIRARMHAGST